MQKSGMRWRLHIGKGAGEQHAMIMRFVIIMCLVPLAIDQVAPSAMVHQRKNVGGGIVLEHCWDRIALPREAPQCGSGDRAKDGRAAVPGAGAGRHEVTHSS